MAVASTQQLNTPGKRLKHVRSLLRISRAYLQTKYGIPEVTLKSWENGTTKLTHSGAQRCVEFYRAEGFIVSEDWILEGVGLDPTAIMSVSHYFAMPSNEELQVEDDEIAMIRDANIFKQNHANAIIMVVSNDEMRPFYRPGDYIGGKIRQEEKIISAVNRDCIVYLKNGGRFFRRLVKNSQGGFNLSCLNPNEHTTEPVLYNVEIDVVAPVIWHRSKDE